MERVDPASAAPMTGMAVAKPRRHWSEFVAFILMAARHYLANRFVLANPRPHRLPSWVGETYVTFVAAGLQDTGNPLPAG